MHRLTPADLEKSLRFVDEAAAIVAESADPFPAEVLSALQQLVPCDRVG